MWKKNFLWVSHLKLKITKNGNPPFSKWDDTTEYFDMCLLSLTLSSIVKVWEALAAASLQSIIKDTTSGDECTKYDFFCPTVSLWCE